MYDSFRFVSGPLNARNPKLETLLYMAAEYGWSEVVALLLKAGALGDLQAVSGNMPLLIAAGFPTLKRSQQLVETFRSLLRKGTVEELTIWMTITASSGLSDLATFALGLEQDRLAVEAAVTQNWSNGPTEGHVNRLKFVKRQGYRRASFDLLKARVLPLPT